MRVEWHGGAWFVETVSIFGDGASSTLFHTSKDGQVDGRLRVARLSGGSVRMTGYQRLYVDPADRLALGAREFPLMRDGKQTWLAAIPYARPDDAGGKGLRLYP